jgi:hypothetical protein
MLRLHHRVQKDAPSPAGDGAGKGILKKGDREIPAFAGMTSKKYRYTHLGKP